MREVVRKEIQQMLEWRVKKESHSNWGAPIVMLQKKKLSEEDSPENSFCVDYRRLHRIIELDRTPPQG